MARLLMATTNQGKIRELRLALEGFGLEVCSLADLKPMPVPEETGATFEENALLKARFYRERVAGFDVLADDSGLEIDAWGGAPGVYSARFLGEHLPYSERNRMVLDRLAGEANRTARFVCVLALALADGRESVFRGEVEGRISEAPSGADGFGYDPIFYYPPLGCSFAELTPVQKSAISHRGRALRQFVEALPGMKL